MFLISVTNRAAALQKQQVEIIAKATNEQEAKEETRKLNEKFYNTQPFLYTPQGFYDRISKYLPEFQFILSTSVGIKLKRIARVK